MRKMAAMILSIGIVFSTMNISAQETGWNKSSEGKWNYVLEDGSLKKGWLLTDNWYYFNHNGEMLTGWQRIEGKQYYFYENGKMATGIIQVNGLNYELSSDGVYRGSKQVKGARLSGYENVDKAVLETIQQIIEPGMSEIEEIQALNQFMSDHVTYTSGYATVSVGSIKGRHIDEMGKLAEGLNEVQSWDSINKSFQYYAWAYDTLLDGKGVTINYNALFNTLADALGYRSSVLDGYYEGVGRQTSLLWWKGKWLMMDTQLNDTEENEASDKGFLVDYDEQTSFKAPVIDNYFDLNNSKTQFEQNWEYNLKKNPEIMKKSALMNYQENIYYKK